MTDVVGFGGPYVERTYGKVNGTLTNATYFLACTFIRSRCSANTLSKGFDCVRAIVELRSRVVIKMRSFKVHWVVRWGLIYVV